ncbi:MAG: ATP synthase F1 subunit delta [Acidobacteria bacterium]|nr:ATP synthase F1 subunit delta [Acidobacteriota bacterium]MBI3280219.1 ATP synthase F1 subunit delta [Acidobacteriota bacterium]
MPQAVAAKYAGALADIVAAPGSGLDAKQVSAELHSFGEALGSAAELRNVLLSPAVSLARKRDVVRRLAEVMGLSPTVRNFLFVIIDRRRVGRFHEIASGFEEILDERMGIVRADVTSAAPLAPGQQAELEQALARVTGKQVRPRYAIDESLIGGVVARIGSTIYDGSVRGQLETLRQRLAAS